MDRAFVYHLLIYPSSSVDYPNRSNDIALLKLRRKGSMGITFTENVAPVCLPTYDTPQKPGKNCIVSGWGKTDGKLINNNCLWPKWVET